MMTARTPGIFGFEEVTEKLEWMPLAARRALDVAGLHISLATWQAFELGRRRALVELGAADDVDVVRVHELVGEERLTSESVSLGSGPGPSAELRALLALGDERLSAAWPSLSPLGRYALEKMAASQRRDPEEQRRRLREACDELCPGPALTHLDARGEAHMVDVSEKSATPRYASASASLLMQQTTFRLLEDGRTPKGDVLATARIAGIQAAKRTWELIPLCHAIALSSLEVELSLDAGLPGVRIVARARTVERTGVEMEALVAASVAGLTLYDMLKAVDRGMVLEAVRLEEKSGGRSGDYLRSEP